MKKLKIFSIALSVTALAMFLFANATSTKDSLLMENVAALAGDPNDNDNDNDNIGDGKYGFVFCDGHNVICTGSGSLKCCV